MSVLGRVTDPFDEEACKDYFIERYYNERQTTLQKGGKFRPHVLDCEDRSCKLPLLRSAAILPWILQDEELFRMWALTAQLSSQPFFNLLWELYGTNPEILLQMHRCAEATKLNERLHEEKDLRLSFDIGPVVESSTISGALRNASLRDSGSGLASNESPSSALASNIRRQFVGLTQGDDYRSYFQSEYFFYHEDGDCIGRLRKGLTAIINEALPLLTKCQVKQSIARLPDIPSPRSIRSSILERMEQDNAGAHVLFSASGTGKTRHIFELLSNHWGFYLVADNHGDYDQRPGGLFLPQQSGASRDMHSFCSDLREIASLSRVTHRGYDLCEVLLATRLLVFFTAVKHKSYRSSGGSAGPMSWLWMQVNCTSKNDPFDTVYRLLRLQNSSGLRRTVTEQWSQSWQLFGGNYLWELLYSPPGQPNRLYVCIDEAQNILQTCEVVPGLMAAMMNMIYRRIPADRHPHSASVAIFSGTSLKLQAFNAELESWTDYLKRFGDLLPQSNAKTPSVDQSFDHSRFAIQTDFELIATNEDLENLWKTYVEGMIIETQDCRDVQPPHLLFRSGRRFDEDSWSALCGFRRKYTTDRARQRYNELFQHYSSQILEHGRPFRGRCRWSTLYIEELLRRIHQHDGIEPDMIRDAMEHAIDEVKRGLGEQLHRLHESKERRQLESYQRTLLDDIYWASIMADLLNMPITLTSNEAEQAVTEGFAIVQHIEDKIQRTMVRIAEPLAVDAAVNYLHSKQPTYEAELWQHLLLSSQIDDESQSTFGKYSEYYFAWRLANFLRDNRKAEYIKSRRIFLRALGCAKLVPKRNRGDPSERHKDELYNSAPRLNSSDFNLTTFRLVRKSWTSLRGTKDHTAWLKSVEEKKQISTFCFPQNKAGPDLLFVLNGEKDGKLTSVLCAMQFKVKKKVASNEYVESLIPSEKWLPTKWNLGPVVLILVSAAEDIDDDGFFKKGFGDVRNAKDLEEGGRLRDVDFYLCKIDRKFSQDLWGEVWMRLMVSMKKQEDLA